MREVLGEAARHELEKQNRVKIREARIKHGKLAVGQLRADYVMRREERHDTRSHDRTEPFEALMARNAELVERLLAMARLGQLHETGQEQTSKGVAKGKLYEALSPLVVVGTVPEHKEVTMARAEVVVLNTFYKDTGRMHRKGMINRVAAGLRFYAAAIPNEEIELKAKGVEPTGNPLSETFAHTVDLAYDWPIKDLSGMMLDRMVAFNADRWITGARFDGRKTLRTFAAHRVGSRLDSLEADLQLVDDGLRTFPVNRPMREHLLPTDLSVPTSLKW